MLLIDKRSDVSLILGNKLAEFVQPAVDFLQVVEYRQQFLKDCAAAVDGELFDITYTGELALSEGTGVGRVFAGQHLEKTGLAAAVYSHKSHVVAFVYEKADVAEYIVSAEGKFQSGRIHQRHCDPLL